MSGPVPYEVALLIAPEQRQGMLEALHASPADAGTAAGLREELIAPLEAWLHTDLTAGSIPAHAAAAMRLADTAAALERECLRLTGADLPHALLEALDTAWIAWAEVMAAGAVAGAVKRQERARTHGARGGRAPKRQAWADLTARKLKRRAGPDRTEAEAWELVPTEPGVWEFGPEGAAHTVYRDGDTLRADPAFGSSAIKRELARSSFLRHYLRPARERRGQ